MQYVFCICNNACWGIIFNLFLSYIKDAALFVFVLCDHVVHYSVPTIVGASLLFVFVLRTTIALGVKMFFCIIMNKRVIEVILNSV